MSVRFNAPPGWPVPSSSWAPDDEWMPDASWPTPPRGWTFWTVDEGRADLALLAAAGLDPAHFDDARTDARLETPRFGTPPRTTAGTTTSTYGTDRGSWLASLRARASSEFLDAATTTPSRAATATPAANDTSWELDGLLTSAGRLDI